MKTIFARKALVVLAALLLVSTLAAQDGFYVRDGDTVVFYGDSITDSRQYTNFVETFILTRYPKMNVRFVHSGWGGDRVGGGGGGPIDVRLQRDVIAYKPTVMTVMLGMNDGRYRAFDDAIFKEYASGYEHIVDVMKKAVPGIRMTLIQPSPFDDVTREPQFPGGYNEVLVRYGRFVKELAERNGMAVADLNGPVVEALKKANATDRDLAQRMIPDRVHPATGGHLLMAACLLKAWGAKPTVTAVEIDAASSQVRKAENTAVTGLSGGKTVAWTQRDGALPMPVNARDRGIALALASSDFTETLNQQTLRVTGLTGESYRLRISGTEVGSFTAAQLAAGVNLAVLPTPMARQAVAVHEMTQKRSNIHNTRWRQVQVPLSGDSLPRMDSVIDNLDALDADLATRQRTAAQPAACYYELIASAPAQAEAGAQTVDLAAGELRLVVGNEADHGAGRTGYIGIWRLTSVHEPKTLFVPKYAGLITHRNRATVTRVSSTEASIQHFNADGSQSTKQTIRLVPPYAFDCVFTRKADGPVTFGAASYMNGPDDPGIYFLDPDGRWQRHYDPVHGSAATVLPAGMPVPVVEKVPDSPYPSGTRHFADSFSKWRYDPDHAFYYGRFGEMVFVHMFPPRSNAMPYMSPRGGGARADGKGTNPAWDWRVQVAPLDGEARLTLRMVYKKYVSDEDVLEEYRSWTRTLHQSR